MTTGRLTRQELGWLLAQEARGAAQALRHGLSQPPGAPTPAAIADIKIGEMNAPPAGLADSLDTLDGAINLLSELESAPSSKGRRGRIDIAALLCDLAPDARIAIQPGAGTEVFGDPADLKRMFHVLVSQTQSGADNASEIKIRREDEWVRIIVDLGPDIAVQDGIERRWLSRMAIRHGGRYELEGRTQSVLLPADASSEKTEVAELRRELEQAQQLGETYARELAAVFETSAAPVPEVTVEASEISEARLRTLIATARATVSVLRPLCEGFRADAGLPGADHVPEALKLRIAQRTSSAHELLGELARVGALDPSEAKSKISIDALLTSVIEDAGARAARHGVRLRQDAAGPITAISRRAELSVLVRTLIDHAVAATPKGSDVNVLSESIADGVVISVADGGPVVPAAALADLIESKRDASSFGRPAGVGLVIVQALAAHLGATLAASETAEGQGRFILRVSLPAA